MKTALTTLAVCLTLAGCSSNKTNQPSASQTPAGGSTAPSGQEAASQKKALVRFAQAVPGNQSLDLWFGDMKVFSNVAYKQVTPYIEVPAERHDFKLQTTGDTQTNALATNSEGLTAGAHYTILAERKSPKDQTLTIDPLNDDLAAPADGKAKIRVINAALGLGKLDVVGPDGKMFSGVGENSSTSYKDVAALHGPIEIRRSDKKVDVLRVTNLNMEAGKIYTIIIVGGAGRPIEAVNVSDQQTVPAGIGG